jgi:hypothetical protein
MRLSEFRLAVDDEFGAARGRALVREMSLGDMDGLTAEQALAAGRPAAAVWAALCRENDVPVERRHGRGLPDPR